MTEKGSDQNWSIFVLVCHWTIHLYKEELNNWKEIVETWNEYNFFKHK